MYVPMAAQEKLEQQISSLFSLLGDAISDEDDEAALELSEKILGLSRDDEEALHCKIVSLIHLSKFTHALEAIRGKNKKKNAVRKYQFEEAYCLYRQNKFKESMDIVTQQLGSRDEGGVAELKAQILYKQEEYERTAETYKKLVDGEANSNDERVANYYAALSLSGGGVVSPCTNTMEQCFNLACCRLGSGCGQEAMSLLDRAETLYQESLEEEGLTEEEIAEEMGVVQVQRAYINQILERPKEALSCYNSILKLRPSNSALVAIASNNILVLNGDRDVFDSKKRIKVLTGEENSKKLTQSQKYQILFNRCMFALQTNQLEQCRDLGTKLKAAQADSDLSILGEVALLYREKKVSPAIEVLENHLKKNASAGVEIYAILSQLYLNQGHTHQACSTLKAIPAYPRLVGVASTLAGLHVGVGDVGGAMSVLDEVFNYWLQLEDTSPQVEAMRRKLATQVARFYLSAMEYERAAVMLERFVHHHKGNLKLQALLISAYSHYDPQRAEEVSRTLPAFQGSSRALDPDQLEKVPLFRQSRRPAERVEVSGKSLDAVKEKKKKKRKPRLPKNFDPEVTPDPERWLPLRERSYYRKSRRKGMASTSRGTQGTSAASAHIMSQLDASNKPPPSNKTSSEGPEVPSPRAKPAAAPQGTKKKGRKKKGGKW